MFGLIVKLTSAAGRRDDLIGVMGGEDSHAVPGCLSFVVAEDAADEDVLWVTEFGRARRATGHRWKLRLSERA